MCVYAFTHTHTQTYKRQMRNVSVVSKGWRGYLYIHAFLLYRRHARQIPFIMPRPRTGRVGFGFNFDFPSIDVYEMYFFVDRDMLL